MVDAARQMLDELMGRNRNLHPSEAGRKVNWDDPEFCPFHIVQFCPHDLFVNTRADLGPCSRVHDDEAKRMFDLARPCTRKRYYEDEFMRFCNTMLNDVDRKISKGKQRLQLMQRDQPKIIMPVHVSKYQEQLNNLDARIKKLLTEAEEAGIRGDVDQAQDLMTLCEQLKEEKDGVIAHHNEIGAGNNLNNKDALTVAATSSSPATAATTKTIVASESVIAEKPIVERKTTGPAWVQELSSMQEKQMEVCEVCGAFLIVGDAQQRIEDHLTGKQHLGYARLRNTVAEIHERRVKERDEDERKRREERGSNKRSLDNFDKKRETREVRDYREHDKHERDQSRHSADKHRHHHKSRRRSHSRTSSRSRVHRHESRERSRSHSRY